MSIEATFTTALLLSRRMTQIIMLKTLHFVLRTLTSTVKPWDYQCLDLQVMPSTHDSTCIIISPCFVKHGQEITEIKLGLTLMGVKPG